MDLRSGAIHPSALGIVLPDLCRLAERAGAKAMTFHRRCSNVTLKSDSSPVTDADRASHEFLTQALPELVPGIPVVSEESADPAHQLAQSVAAGRFWLVDPLDGTKEFLKGSGQFTVNIALVERGRPILGVVHAPALNRLFYADLDGGAFRSDGHGQATPIHVQRADRGRLRVVASRDHAGPLVRAMLARLTNPELKSMGSSLKFCLVAEGQADIYLRDVPTMEWDTAAAQCLVEAAGGTVCTLDGQPLRYGKPGLKNPAIVTVGDPELPWASWIDR